MGSKSRVLSNPENLQGGCCCWGCKKILTSLLFWPWFKKLQYNRIVEVRVTKYSFRIVSKLNSLFHSPQMISFGKKVTKAGNTVSQQRDCRSSPYFHDFKIRTRIPSYNGLITLLCIHGHKASNERRGVRHDQQYQKECISALRIRTTVKV